MGFRAAVHGLAGGLNGRWQIACAIVWGRGVGMRLVSFDLHGEQAYGRVVDGEVTRLDPPCRGAG